MLLGGKVFTNIAHNGWVNFAIVVSKDTWVIGSSCKGDGSMTWVTIDSVYDPLSIALVYAPTHKEAQREF